MAERMDRQVFSDDQRQRSHSNQRIYFIDEENFIIDYGTELLIVKLIKYRNLETIIKKLYFFQIIH